MARDHICNGPSASVTRRAAHSRYSKRTPRLSRNTRRPLPSQSEIFDYVMQTCYALEHRSEFESALRHRRISSTSVGGPAEARTKLQNTPMIPRMRWLMITKLMCRSGSREVPGRHAGSPSTTARGCEGQTRRDEDQADEGQHAVSSESGTILQVNPT